MNVYVFVEQKKTLYYYNAFKNTQIKCLIEFKNTQIVCVFVFSFIYILHGACNENEDIFSFLLYFDFDR